MNASPLKSDFVNVNGIRLHYLDWGGSGPALVFIPGWGCSAYIFSQFAPRFRDHFHVYGFTRRGHGDSDYPETGYDPDTLTEDLRQFLDKLGLDPVILVGHSLAYIELTSFATKYPRRVAKLVFLDSIYEHQSPEYQDVLAKNPVPGMLPAWPTENPASPEAFKATAMRLFPSLAAIWGAELEEDFRHNIQPSPAGGWVEKATDPINKAIGETVRSYAAPYTEIQAPLLSIFVLGGGSNYISSDFMDDGQRAQVLDYFKHTRGPYYQRHIENFKQAMPQARVFVIPDGHHYCFIQQAEPVFNEMRAFLLEG